MARGHLWLAAALLACNADPAQQPAAQPQPSAPTSQHHGLAWYEDAPAAALADAKRANKLVLVDLWAPWCHTCLSMREYVLRAENLRGVSERLIFLALNSERETNADFLQRFPIGAWPTFYLVGGDQSLHGRWVGAATPAQLVQFVRDGLRSFDSREARALAADDPLALLLAGDRLAAEQQPVQAVDKYEAALTRAPADWPRRADTLVALAAALHRSTQNERCVALALAREPSERNASATDFFYHALACANDLPATDPRVLAVRKRAQERLAGLCDGGAELTPDDRGDACGLLRNVCEKLGHGAGALRAAEKGLAVLEAAAANVPDEVALTYDSARAETLVELGRGLEAITFLEARERALPTDYNPPYHLARTYRALERWEEGLAAIERALAKAYGPRQLVMLGLKADLLLGGDRRDEARKLVEAQLAGLRALPSAQRQPAREQAVEKRLREWH